MKKMGKRNTKTSVSITFKVRPDNTLQDWEGVNRLFNKYGKARAATFSFICHAITQGYGLFRCRQNGEIVARKIRIKP